MAVFKMIDCDFGFTLNGTNYQFTHVESFQIEDPERTRLVRGSNAGNKLGIVYTEGAKEAKVGTLTVLDMPVAVHELLKKAYVDKTRMDCWGISRSTGSSKTMKNAVLVQSPKQLNVDDSPESMQVALIFESFDVDEVLKD